MSIVSNNIKYLRRLNGLTQEQFARRIGIKRPSIGAYEEARAHPPYDTLITMAKLFGVTVDQLIKTDLRKVRETPDLGLGAPATNQTPSPQPSPPPVNEPQPIATLVEKYYRDDRTQIRLVAQRVMLKRVTIKPGSRNSDRPTVSLQGSLLPSFNNNYEAPNGRQAPPPQPPTLPTTQAIPLVRQNQAEDYARRSRDAAYLEQLPTLQVPLLPAGTYRAFEAGNDFAFPGASLVGKFVGNWFELEDSRHYVLVIQNRGTLYRRVYNQVKIKGTLLLSGDDPAISSLEIPIKDVLEAWEVKAFLSYELPKPGLSAERLRGLVEELQQELQRV
ncbi:MAG: helix-turn-helix domain-containing protein [Cytophagaceae bacterium]|nr:helix-turn-helix domain-containing protein [Cytophagaceae bacterium]